MNKDEKITACHWHSYEGEQSVHHIQNLVYVIDKACEVLLCVCQDEAFIKTGYGLSLNHNASDVFV